jgi:hypothetical protein
MKAILLTLMVFVLLSSCTLTLQLSPLRKSPAQRAYIKCPPPPNRRPFLFGFPKNQNRKQPVRREDRGTRP